MTPAVMGLIVLAVVILFYVTEWLPIAVTTVLACCALTWLQVQPFSVNFSGFASDTVWLVTGMIMVGAALFETGAADLLGKSIIKVIGASETKLVVIVYPLTMLMSAFLNNSATTSTFMPIIQAIAAKSDGKVSAKKMLMPLAWSATAGRMLTLIGSTPPVLIHGVMVANKLPTFGFFEWGYPTLPIAIIMIGYILTVYQKMATKMWKDEINAETVSSRAHADLNVNVAEKVYPKGPMYTAFAILAFCILGFILQPTFGAAAFGKGYSFGLGLVAITGAMLCIVFKTMTVKRLYELNDWTSFFVLAGAIGYAAALDKCGSGKLIADVAVKYVGNSSPFIIFATFVLVGMVLTQMMSNTATAAMMGPIGIFIANGLGFSPLPLMMGLAASCAAAFMTPVGTPPNTIVLGAGNYRFMDYMKLGGIVQLISYVVIVALVPLIWPL